MNKREAQELLPWFVAGSLSADESTAVQAFIDSGEIASNELAEFEMFAAAVNEQSADEPVYRADVLADVMAQLDATPQAEVEPAMVVQEAVAEPGLWGKLTAAIDNFSWSMTPPLAKVAMVGQFALVIALGTLVFSEPTQQQEVVSHTVSGSASAGSADLTIMVSADVSEAAFRMLLQDIEAEIVAGPNALGMYEIDLPEGANVAAERTALEANPLIDFAQPVAK